MAKATPAPATPAAPGAASTVPARPVRTAPRLSIEQLLSTERLSGLSFSPDGKRVLVSSDRSGVWNAYAIPVAGGEPEPLTLSTTESIRVHSYFPGDERFLFTSDRGGDERTHVYMRDLSGGVRDFTPGDGLKAEVVDWSLDEKSFYVVSNERDARYFDLYEYGTNGRGMVLQNDTGLVDPLVSPDRRYVAATKIATDYDSDAWLFDRQSGQLRNLTAGDAEVVNRVVGWSPDAAWLFLLSDRDADFVALHRLELATGRVELVLRPEWDITSARLTRDHRHLVVNINRDARTQLVLLDAATLREVPLPQLPDLDITAAELSRDGALLAFYAGTSSSPRDLYVCDLATREVKRLTHSLGAGIDARDLVAGEVVRFASYDGVEIPGILYRPHEASPTSTVPAVVWVHGGPGGQSRLEYDAFVQYLVNHGYAVYAINNRGSGGYGRRFSALDDRKHGEADLDDLVAAKGMLAATGWVDPARVAVLGGSYGGYLVLAALAFRPEVFNAGVDIFGVANWPRTLSSMPAWWEAERQAIFRELGDPAQDAERLRRISPLFNTEKIARPLMVLQGANDPRVLKVESDEIVAAVRARGVPVEYVVFPDEGHGFAKKANQISGYRAVREFLDRYLVAP